MQLNKGTIEYVKVTIGDRSDTPITDLTTHSPQFKITTFDELTDVVAYTAAVASLMILYCLVDTTIAGFVIGDNYKMYCKFSASPEFPVLGPVGIRIA